MAQPIYSTSVTVDEFKGLNQTGTGANMHLKFATDMENVNVRNGVFSQMREGRAMAQVLEKPIGTLAYLSRRYVTVPDTLLVAISDGRVFTKQLDGDDEWVQRYPPLVNTAGAGEDPVYEEDGDPLTESDCDWLTYEVTSYPMYSEGRTYVVGERCTHEYSEEPEPQQQDAVAVEFYKCKSAIGTAKEWDPTDWNAMQIEPEPAGGFTNVIPIYSPDRGYKKGEYVAKDVTEEGAELHSYKIYSCNVRIWVGEDWNADHWTEKYSATAYDDTATYAKGAFCVIERYPDDGEEEEEEEKELRSYVCTTAVTQPGAWNASNWEWIEEQETVDILLFTNARDGLHCLYGDTLQVVPVWVTPDPENKPEENIKFGVLARYNERIWGSGIDGEPDRLVYSAPYAPFDWTPNVDIPEDGAGDIMQPTWDGDQFLALKQFGSDLLAIKRNSVWRIYGTHPGEFAMVRQYGGGTIVENTVAVHNQYMYMLGEHGLMRYDSVGAYAFMQDVVQRIMAEDLNRAYIGKACAAMWNGTYCMAIPVKGSSFCNAMLQYDPEENTFAYRTEISVDSFLQLNERLLYTSAVEPGVVFEMDDSQGKVKNVRWYSGYQDLGLKNSIKSAFILYMMVDSEAPVEMRVGIRTEKKLKQKTFMTKPGKMTRIHLNTQGREFRLEISSYSAVPFRIGSGLKIDLELDPD